MKRAKKQKLFNLGIFFLDFVLMSYLFVFPYHYKVSFTTKQPPGVVLITLWRGLNSIKRTLPKS